MYLVITNIQIYFSAGHLQLTLVEHIYLLWGNHRKLKTMDA